MPREIRLRDAAPSGSDYLILRVKIVDAKGALRNEVACLGCCSCCVAVVLNAVADYKEIAQGLQEELVDSFPAELEKVGITASFSKWGQVQDRGIAELRIDVKTADPLLMLSAEKEKEKAGAGALANVKSLQMIRDILKALDFFGEAEEKSEMLAALKDEVAGDLAKSLVPDIIDSMRKEGLKCEVGISRFLGGQQVGERDVLETQELKAAAAKLRTYTRPEKWVLKVNVRILSKHGVVKRKMQKTISPWLAGIAAFATSAFVSDTEITGGICDELCKSLPPELESLGLLVNMVSLADEAEGLEASVLLEVQRVDVFNVIASEYKSQGLKYFENMIHAIQFFGEDTRHIIDSIAEDAVKELVNALASEIQPALAAEGIDAEIDVIKQPRTALRQKWYHHKPRLSSPVQSPAQSPR